MFVQCNPVRSWKMNRNLNIQFNLILTTVTCRENSSSKRNVGNIQFAHDSLTPHSDFIYSSLEFGRILVSKNSYRPASISLN